MGNYIPPPILNELKKVDLVTYFRTIMPYELVKVSANEYTTKTHDSLGCQMDYGIGVQEDVER